jgi:hypothetical protein
MKVKFIYNLYLIFFLLLDNKVPGPQKYNSKYLINGTGYIFNSKFTSSPGKSISGRYNLAQNKLKSEIFIFNKSIKTQLKYFIIYI